MLTRREALQGLAAATLATAASRVWAAPATADFGLAYTSFAVRLLQGRDIMKADAQRLTADAFFRLCQQFKASGGQVDLSQVPAGDAAFLKTLRAWLDEHALFAELSIPARTLESEDAFDRAAAVARALDASRLRVALLSGRRYESFPTAAKWQAFADHWIRVLTAIKPAVERHRLHLGIENHKDWTAAELAALLKRLDSPYIGACVDFGNNVAFLEDPLELVTTLAPWAVTTHLKDMAVRRYERGFELSEVPLGAGILPLGEMIRVLRQAKPDIHFCLEMITRDPLEVPYLEDGFWAPFGGRSGERVASFERTLLARSSDAPLPRITGLSPAAQVAAEDDNVRRSEAFARSALHL
jgi:sugar phosphate isomerase/epimerase